MVKKVGQGKADVGQDDGHLLFILKKCHSPSIGYDTFIYAFFVSFFLVYAISDCNNIPVSVPAYVMSILPLS